MTEWDGTDWAGTPIVPHRFQGEAVKASNSVVGVGASFYAPGSVVLSTVKRNPLKVMREAQASYHQNPWIGLAERTVTRKVANLPWHVEDETDDEVDDETTDPLLLSIQGLLEKPQAALPPNLRQPGISTGRALKEITSRHAGLCGVSYWFLDQMDTNGWPLAILYINPARLMAFTSDSGNLLGWGLDPKDETGRGAVPLRTDEVLPFYLEVPDFGHTPVGLVEAAAMKAQVSSMVDRHSAYVLGSGGRIAGIIAPREGYIGDELQWKQLQSDFRGVAEAADAAKRTTVVRGPIDFTKTAADPSELGLMDMGKGNRDDILAIWGVPPSQAGIQSGAVGLNSGETRKYEYEILMTGAVHDRVNMLVETIQYGLMDRLKTVGRDPQYEIEEPDFGDDSGSYDLAKSAVEQPMTMNERREILDLDPLPDYGPDGEPLGLAIYLPSTLVMVGQGGETGAKRGAEFTNAPAPKPEPTPPPAPEVNPQTSGVPPMLMAVKADELKAGLGIRSLVDEEITPEMQNAVAAFLKTQEADILRRVESRAAHVLSKPSEVSAWWNQQHWDEELQRVLAPHIERIASTVAARAGAVLKPAKGSFEEEVVRQALTRVGLRITKINETTRDEVANVIRKTVSDATTIREITEAIRGIGTFDDARSEVIARTESGNTYNTAAVASYREYGVQRVKVIDGDDDICARANGAVWTLEEAESEPLGHPNCRRDFAPYL